jgi:hypothetical protein
MIRIDFNQLLDNYNNNLLDNLRGFGKDKEYLKFWVPGVTPEKSFFNLIDALTESNDYEFLVYFKINFFKKLAEKEILFFLNQIGNFKKITKDNFLMIEIKINKETYENLRQTKKDNQKKNTENFKIDKKDKITISQSNEKIDKLYSEKLKYLSAKDYYSNKIPSGSEVYIARIDNFNLYFLIKNKIIVELCHDYKNKDIISKLINLFIDICVNKNIQEAADHSVIYLEEKIRLLDSSKLIRPGIILPFHAGNYFDKLNWAIRKLFDQYKEKNEVKFGVNKNYFKKSFHWINLTEASQIKKINLILFEIIEKYNLLNQSIIVHRIDNNFKINLAVDSLFKKEQAKTNILLEIEIKLKVLDDTLEVFVDEVLDQNKIRLKNSPQVKLLK